MAGYDLPAVFTHIHDVTKQKIHYIGRSQGTMQMHIALSKRNPVVETLMDKYFGFGPVAYTIHQTSQIMTLLNKSHLIDWYHMRHIYEFMPSLNWF